MAKKPTVTTLQSGFNSTEVLNENFDNIRDAFDNTLSLDGSTPNAMQADLDLNGNNLIGATGLLINGTDYLADVETAKAAALVAQAAAELAENNAETAEVNAEASETAAGLSATAAATSATDALTSRGAAEIARTGAETAETGAVASAVTAASEAATATTKASEASASAAAAAASEAGVDADRVAAQAAASAAATSETNAATSATNAATSATNAANSATSASNSASSASSSAANAGSSETAASTSATAAAASALAAAGESAEATTQASNAAASATAAATSETNSASSASSAASSASSAQASKDAALAALDSFDDRYLGQKVSDPTLDNDGNPLVAGALYFNTTDDVMKVYEGSVWVAAYASLSGALLQANNLSDVADVAASRTNLGLGTGNTPTFAGINTTGNATFGDNDKAIFGAGSDLQIYHSGSHSYITDTGTGSLYIRGTNTVLTSAAGETYANFVADGETSLYYNGTKTIKTTPTGIDVTGTVTADGLTVSASVASSAIASVTNTDTANGNGLFIKGGGANSGKYTILSQNAAGGTNLKVGNNGDISFYEATGTTPKFFWDASAERSGIGTSSPDEKLEVYQGNIKLGTDTNTTSKLIFERAAVNRAEMYVGSSYQFQFDVGGLERMRIDSSGNLLVGTTTPVNSASTTNDGVTIYQTGRVDASRVNSPVLNLRRRSTDGPVVLFYRDTTNVGSISVTTAATSYNTSSDYRLKTDAQPMTGASARVQALKPVNFEWIADGTRVDGFLAHEAQEIVPEAVTGTKDAVDADGNPEYQAIDQSKLVPLLTAALQEALIKIEALEARVTALEA